MWYTPLGSRPASAECSQTYQKLVQGERSGYIESDLSDTPIRGIILITGGKQATRMPFSLFSPFRRTACEIPRMGYYLKKRKKGRNLVDSDPCNLIIVCCESIT